jgi:pimeloyl-ACP methyl ester carboxylesterase
LLEGPHPGAVAHPIPDMKLNECWTKIDGHRMRYLQAGAGTPLLLVHGLLGGSFCWRLALPELARQYDVYAVDLPGASQSRDMGIDCSIACQAGRLSHFIRQMGWKEVALMGSSFGGAIAMMVASQQQSLRTVRSLVLVSPVNPWSDFGQGRIRFLSSRFGGWFLRMALPLSRPCHPFALRRMYGDPRRIPEGTLEGYRASILDRGRAANVLTALRNWQRDLEALREIIPKLKFPTLLIWGTQDKAVDPGSAEKLRERLPNATLKWISGAGHLPFEEAPEELNRLVLEFLGKTGGIG